MDQSLIDLFSLDDRVAIVTGSTKGLGHAMALGLSQAGATVVVSSRNQDACDQVAAEISAETGRPTLAAALHMGDWDAAETFVELVEARLGRIDVLVNNAGIHPGPAPVVGLQQAYIDKLYEVNLRGPVRLAGLCAPVMAKQGKGSIINVATVGAYHGGSGVGVYTSLKAALVTFTKVMAAEMAPLGIRANAIAPGPFDSEMMRGADRMDDGFSQRSAAATMQKRVADCREIVGATLYLASDASSYTTGDDHIVAGGMLR
jgi:NAD(P)-dependent dehydrogenase (short-subunit alcohol dehydrogenase family)